MKQNMITASDINGVVWKACDTFRGLIDPSQYKDYILTMLFLKYVSDVHDDIYQEYLTKYKGDKTRTERAMRLERFLLPNQSSFNYLYERRGVANVGELINTSLNDLEEANREKLFSEDGTGIFRNIDFNSSNLGDVKDKNTRLRNLLIDFSELDLSPSHLEHNDVIGDAYEFLIASFASDAGKKAGEFYTPGMVSTLLAKLTRADPGARICDPTCGSASLLVKAGREVGSPDVSLYGQEANGSTWALAVQNMFLHGFDGAVIRWGDTIRNPKLKEGDHLMKFDVVVANPPFSLDKWGADDTEKDDKKNGKKSNARQLHNSYKAAADPYNRFWRGIPPKSKGDWAFISHMIEVAYDGHGKVGVVVPHGVLFRGGAEGKIRQKTIEDNLLDAVIGLPANLFYGTGIPAAILIFNKGRGKKTDVLFVDASQCFENGKNQNRLRPQDLEVIVGTYDRFAAGKLSVGVVEEKFSYIAKQEEIIGNDHNLNIPRYVDTFEEEAEIDIAATQKEIKKLKTDLAAVEVEMTKHLKELGYKTS